MAFSFRCLLGHNWDGCACRRCNPEGRVTTFGWRNREHDLDGCFCRRCRTLIHDWDGCVCRRCEEAQDLDHDLRDGACARCGAAVLEVQDVPCPACGGSGEKTFGQDWPPQSDVCRCCNGNRVIRQNVWGPPLEPCLRPRPRPDTEARLATVGRDSSVAALARGIRESGDWSGFAALRDALLEAGCTDEEVLNHCLRKDHAPGCWVLKLLLGTNPTATPSR